MIILIAGSSHTGKTALAQRLLEKYNFPYLSIDHLKMGLIRSGNTSLKIDETEKLTCYLWNILCEMIKTAIENNQNLIVEGCYIPFDWRKHFAEAYLPEIRYYCLIMSKEYIETHFETIKAYANIIEKRLDDSYLTMGKMIRENTKNLELCEKHKCNYILIDKEYSVDIEI